MSFIVYILNCLLRKYYHNASLIASVVLQRRKNLCYSFDSAFCFLPDDPSAAVTASAESFDNCQTSSTNYGPGANDIPFVPPSKKHHLVELYQFAGDYSTKYRKRGIQAKDWRQIQFPASKLRSICRKRRFRFGERSASGHKMLDQNFQTDKNQDHTSGQFGF